MRWPNLKDDRGKTLDLEQEEGSTVVQSSWFFEVLSSPFCSSAQITQSCQPEIWTAPR